MRPAMSSGDRPVELKTTLITGILMLGKMSIGVRTADPTPKIMISSAITMKVYGRRSASLTIPIIFASRLASHPASASTRNETANLAKDLAVGDSRYDHYNRTLPASPKIASLV